MIENFKEDMQRAADCAANHPELQHCKDARDLMMTIIAKQLARQEGRISSKDCANTSLVDYTEYERRKAALPIMDSVSYEKAIKEITDDLQA